MSERYQMIFDLIYGYAIGICICLQLGVRVGHILTHLSKITLNLLILKNKWKNDCFKTKMIVFETKNESEIVF